MKTNQVLLIKHSRRYTLKRILQQSAFYFNVLHTILAHSFIHSFIHSPSFARLYSFRIPPLEGISSPQDAIFMLELDLEKSDIYFLLRKLK